MRLEGYAVNHEHTVRLYREHGLPLRRRRPRRLPVEARTPLLQPIRLNVRWSLDFIGDRLADHRGYRTPDVLDDYAREALAIADST